MKGCLNMKFFIDKKTQVRAFEDNDAPHHYQGMTPITEAQAMDMVAGSKPTTAYFLEQAKSNLRAIRVSMLDALTGIAGRAARAGNDALAAQADALAEQLLDITEDATLNAATTYEDMYSAGVAAYKRIAAGSNPELASVFREITGS